MVEASHKFDASTEEGLTKVEAHLTNNAYLADGPLPGAEDS